jgi:uncharacterized RDD family membrane protein YckC
MKCPKCGYLGFEDVDRCRNCGYEFSLVTAPDIPDLPIRPESRTESTNSLEDDLTLIDAAALSAPLPWQLAADQSRPASARRPRGDELPLFGGSADDDVPLITKPAPPRPPLAVRRSTPEVPRMRAEASRAPLLGLSGAAFESGSSPSAGAFDDAESDEPAGLPARLAAVGLDFAVLAAIDAVVVYFTMQICGLTVDDLSILPKAPLVAFLVLQNGGYLVAFTAGGQTLGKMATGIRVVSTRGDDDTLNVGRSILRTVVWAVLAIPAGLGFVTALFSRERRGLHDYCAGTRVVRSASVH